MDPNAITLRPYAPTDADWVVAAHARLYAADEGYDASFAALVARIVADFERDFTAGVEAGWIAEQHGAAVACIFCVRVNDKTAKLRMFLVDPVARGQGLGRRLLITCMEFARSAGYSRMVLWTHESHRAACALYAVSGWRLVSSVPAHAFGVDVVDQEWEVDL